MARPVDPNAKIELLRAAEAIFVERGLEKARVEEITARAGRSKGSFYLHFASKEEAFRQIVESMMARLASFLDCLEVDVPRDAPLSEALEHMRDREADLFEFLWQNRGLMRLLLQGGGGADFAHLIDAFAERARERTKEALRRGMAAAQYRPEIDLEIASLVISGAYDRLARQLVRLERKPDFHAWVREVQRVLLLGIATPAVRAEVDPPVSVRRVRPSGNRAPDPMSTASAPPRAEEGERRRRPRGGKTNPPADPKRRTA